MGRKLFEKEALQSYINDCKKNNGSFNWKDIHFESPIIPQHVFYDYDKDEEDELITRMVVRGGPHLAIGDSLISIYEFGADQIVLKDSFFRSYNNSLENIF